MRCGTEREIPISLGVPVEARDVSWGHDRRYGAQSCAARMRNRGTRIKRKTANDKGRQSSPDRLPPEI